jgi:rhodanese-related sulfurtransferase
LRRSFLWWLPFGGVPEITPQQLHRWLEEGRPLQLVDSRTRMEYQQGTIAHAPSAPVSELPAALDRLDLDPGKAVVILCLSGHRSRPGTRLLRARGYEAYNLKGGIMAWKRAGYALEKPN